MLDILAAIFATAYCAAQGGLVIGLADIRTDLKLAALAVFGLWMALVAGVYASGTLQPGNGGPPLVNLLPFTMSLSLLFGTWFLSSSGRAALQSVPLPALMAVHVGRIGGFFFLLLDASGRLSGPFGPVAGMGDIITGTVALLLLVALSFGARVRRWWIAAWNAFGTLDLLVALALAALSVPDTPFRIFDAGSGSSVLRTLPWAFVPAILVPVDFLVHYVIAVRLRTAPDRIDGANLDRAHPALQPH